jgi:hypothetical protein
MSGIPNKILLIFLTGRLLLGVESPCDSALLSRLADGTTSEKGRIGSLDGLPKKLGKLSQYLNDRPWVFSLAEPKPEKLDTWPPLLGLNRVG